MRFSLRINCNKTKIIQLIKIRFPDLRIMDKNATNGSVKRSLLKLFKYYFKFSIQRQEIIHRQTTPNPSA